MTNDVSLSLALASFWQAGTGRGEGSGADELICRTSGGLPYLPGRTLCGLLREAMELAEAIGQIETGRTDTILGRRTSDSPEAPGKQGLGRFEPGRDGFLSVTSAFLAKGGIHGAEGRAWEEWAKAPENASAVAQLSQRISSTALDGRGLARHRSLRTMEVAVPMTLYATLSAPTSAGDEWESDVEKAIPLLRAVGSRRSRGFGRCRVTLERSKGGGLAR